MTLRDRDGALVVYSSIDEILRAFYSLRIEFYEKRHKMLIKDYKEEYELVNIKAKFVKDVIEGNIIIFDPSKKKSYTEEEVSAQLIKLEYPKMLDKSLVYLDKFQELDETDKEKANYDYLIGMKLSSLTKKRVEELLGELKILKEKYNILKGKTPIDLWEEDLVIFETQYAKDNKEYEAILAEEFAWGTENEGSSAKGKGKGKAKAKTQVKKTQSPAKEDEEEEKEEDLTPPPTPVPTPVPVPQTNQENTDDTKAKAKGKAKTKSDKSDKSDKSEEEVVVVKKVKKTKKEE